MAIDPSAEYPGQIITGLPGYPLGKAVNVAVSGDGTGTPLEAKWVSDLFGWEQALLDAAGITPSGDPDAVGASDYMDALDALYPAIGRMTTAESDIAAAEGAIITLEATRVTGPASATDEAFARFDLTTGKLLQDGVVKATNAGAVTGVTDLTLSGEVLYSSPKTRVAYVVAGKLTQNIVATALGWNVTDRQMTYATNTGAGSGTLFARLNDYVPTGCTITKIRALIDPSANGTLTTVTVFDRSVSGTTLSTNTTYGPYAGPTASGVVQWVDSGTVSIPVTSAHWLEFQIAVGAVGDIVNLLEITFSDVGPRND